ncbi:MAG: putative metallopeptidase [Thermoprotei archaeon]
MTNSLDAPDVESLAKLIVGEGVVNNVDLNKVRFIRSFNAKFRSYARIFGLSRPIREALKTNVCYVIEVNADLFDGLPPAEKIRVVIHELTHIPNGCNGSLRSHRSRSFRANTQKKARVLAMKLEGSKLEDFKAHRSP